MAAIRPLSEELQKIAIEQLNEVPERLPCDIAALRDFIVKQPHLRARNDDQFLVSFLRGCKYSLEKAKSKIDNFYTIRTMLPDIFANNTLLDQKNLMILRSGALVALPKTLGVGGPVIGLSRYKIIDELPITMKEFCRYTAMVNDRTIIASDIAVIGGYMEIVDLDKVGMSAVSKFDLIIGKQFSTYYLKGSAIRIKGIHVINAPKEIFPALNIVRNLLPAHLKARYFIHRDFQALYKYVPKHYLPIEYGGMNGSLANLPKQHEKELMDFNYYFIENNKYGVDENLRNGQKRDMNSLFGMEGSFRKLETLKTLSSTLSNGQKLVNFSALYAQATVTATSMYIVVFNICKTYTYSIENMVVLRPLPDDLAKKATDELNEKSEDNDFYVNALREWAEKQPHLCARTDDQFLIAFLRGSKFSLEKAKQKLENFYILRAAMPEMFRNRNLIEAKYEAIIKSGAAAILPEPASEGCPLVALLRPSEFNMEQHTITDVLKVGSMMVDILMQENDRVFIAGYTFIIDLGNIPKAVLVNFEPEFIRKLTILINKAAPSRMKGFHFINVLPIFEKLFGMVKSVISAKLKERFYVHGNNFEELYKHIPKHVLPKEYGGDCDIQILQAEWWQKLNDYKKFFEEEDQYGIAEGYERLKQVKELIADTSVLQGTDGSFRQLDFD
ncbi:uncharacterized protein [Eurosta solidaginis]|uniref:uncharacterized protein n=1 Tax=Eurosta solidaginis TaxID=178769 RepID=UPI003530D31E